MALRRVSCCVGHYRTYDDEMISGSFGGFCQTCGVSGPQVRSHSGDTVLKKIKSPECSDFPPGGCHVLTCDMMT